MPDEFDWIQIVSGEWLKGEILVMYDESLEFDSDELDELSFDWGDVKELRSAGPMQARFEDGTVLTGKLLIDEGTVRVLGDQEQSRDRHGLLSITSGHPSERNYWSGKISVGANLRSGNSRQTEVNSRAYARRRTVKTRLGLDYIGNHNVTDDVTAVDNQRAGLAWQWFVSRRFFLSPLLLEYFRDPFQNIAHRGTAGVGAGYQIVDTSKVDWEATVGLAYQNTRFDDVVEGERDSASTPAFTFGTSYDHELSDSVDFSSAYSFYIVDDESGRYTHHVVMGFEFDLIGSLDFDVTFVWDRIQKPRANSSGTVPERDDYRLNFALGFDF